MQKPQPWQSRRAAIDVDRIFKGEKPAELPVQRAGKFESTIGKRSAD